MPPIKAPSHCRTRPRRAWLVLLALLGLLSASGVGPTASAIAGETARPAEAGGATDGTRSTAERDAATRRLIRAAAAGRTRGVQQALDAGARIDEHRARFVGPGRQTALVGAALRGHDGVVRLLLAAGADPSIPEKDGFTVWHAAAFQGRARVLAVLHELEVPGMSPSPADGLWPLHRAAWGQTPRHVEAVRFLIGPAGHPCGVTGPDGRTPLEMAGHAPIRALLEACGGGAPDEPQTDDD